MRTHLSSGTGRGEDAMLLVYLVYVGRSSEAGIPCDNFVGSHVERRAHNGAFGRTLGQSSEGGEALGGGGGETTESPCGC